jgi:hypothetical protein
MKPELTASNYIRIQNIFNKLKLDVETTPETIQKHILSQVEVVLDLFKDKSNETKLAFTGLIKKLLKLYLPKDKISKKLVNKEFSLLCKNRLDSTNNHLSTQETVKWIDFNDVVDILTKLENIKYKSAEDNLKYIVGLTQSYYPLRSDFYYNLVVCKTMEDLEPYKVKNKYTSNLVYLGKDPFYYVHHDKVSDTGTFKRESKKKIPISRNIASEYLESMNRYPRKYLLCDNPLNNYKFNNLLNLTFGKKIDNRVLRKIIATEHVKTFMNGEISMYEFKTLCLKMRHDSSTVLETYYKTNKHNDINTNL